MVMKILDKFLCVFVNNIEKINKIYKFDKIKTNISELFKFNTDIFSVNKLKSCEHKNLEVNTNKNEKNTISLVDEIFNGNNNKIINYFCPNFDIITDISSSNNENHIITVNKKKLNTFKCEFNINFYNLGCVLFPLTFSVCYDSNTYVYNIYKYMYSKSFNSYKSCFISLFYYYFGLMLSLICLYKHDNITILDSNLVVIVCKLASFVKITNCCYSNIFRESIINIKLVNIINNSLYLCGHKMCSYSPYLIGITKYVLTDNGFFSKLSFQETLKFFKNIIFEHKTDWSVDSKSNIIFSDFIPVGSGWYRYFVNK